VTDAQNTGMHLSLSLLVKPALAYTGIKINNHYFVISSYVNLPIKRASGNFAGIYSCLITPYISTEWHKMIGYLIQTSLI